ncbi:MAG: DNA methyltransferase [Candidatus Odinarchaeia archaeon]
MVVKYYFKIFNNIKSEHEVKELARLELEGLFGDVAPIRNFYDCLIEEPLKKFTCKPIRIQDVITHELPYGEIQGYQGVKNNLDDITHLVKRLAYTREIYIVVEIQKKPEEILKIISPDGSININVQYFIKDGFTLFRFITNQYFLEKSFYISKLSRNEEEINNNVKTLFKNLTENYTRIPSSATLAVGKRLEDYFTIREEPSLYLNHYMHPYKGKFHPKMVRALINYIYPEAKGTLMDNFAGSGTLLVEAQYLGLDSLGIEINPLSVLMCNVKCQSITLNPNKLKQSIVEYLNMLKNNLNYFEHIEKGQKLLTSIDIDIQKIKNRVANVSKKLNKCFIGKEKLIQKIIIAQETLNIVKDAKIKDFLLLAISGSISDVARRTKNDFLQVLENRIKDLYLRIYLFHKLNEVLKINLGDSHTYVGDTRNMVQVEDNTIDGIVNSPPYSTALDYIKNDYPQLVILNLVKSLEKLEQDMMGNPRVNYNRDQLLKMLKDPEKDPLKISPLAQKYINILINGGRIKEALRQYKFYIDMLQTLQEMHRILKPKAKAAIIIGDNHFQIAGKYISIPNDQILQELSNKTGYTTDKLIKRKLQKTSVGNI